MNVVIETGVMFSGLANSTAKCVTYRLAHFRIEFASPLHLLA